MIYSTCSIIRKHIRPHLINIAIFFVIFLSLLPGGFVQETVNISHFFSSHHMFEYAFSHGFIFGKDIIDNVGPYGYLHYPYTFAGGAFWTKILWFAMLCGIYAYYATLLMQGIRFLPEKFLFLFTIIFFPLQIKFPWYGFEIIPRLAVLFSGLYFLTASDEKKRRYEVAHIVFNGIFYALLILEKASNVYFLVFLIAVLGVYWVIKLRYKNTLYLLLSFASAMMLFWLLAGQKLIDMPIYFSSMHLFIDSYKNVFSMNMKQNALVYALIYCIIIALILLFRAIVSMLITRTWNEFFQALLISAVMVISWKHGMLRGSDSYGTLLYIIPCIFAFILFYPIDGLSNCKYKNRFLELHLKSHGGLNYVFYALFFAVFWSGMMNYEHEIHHERAIYKEFKDRFLTLVQYKPTTVLKILTTKFENMKKINAISSSLKSIIGNKTIDEFGEVPELILLNNLNYSPRPVPIDMAAGNSALNEMNGRYYQQKHSAPDFVLLRDFKLRLIDTSAYLSLLFNYHILKHAQDWLVLEKNSTWNAIKLQKIAQKRMHVDEWVYLGNLQSNFIWVQINMQPSILGKIRWMLYKLDKVRLDVLLMNGLTESYFISLTQLDAGFLLNPIIKSKNLENCINYDASNIPWKKVKAFKIAIDPSKKQFLFNPYYNIIFSKVIVYSASMNNINTNVIDIRKQISFLRKNICSSLHVISLNSILGLWTTNGKSAYISLDNNILTLHNEFGSSSRCELSKNHRFLYALDWNNIHASLDENNKYLTWSNGTAWTRASN